MNTDRMGSREWLAALAVVAAVLAVPGCASRTPSAKSTAPAAEQRFASPKAAVDALIAACRSGDESRLLAIFGEQARPVISTGDAAADRERCQRLVEAAQQTTRLDPKGPDAAQLVLGTDDWPFPVPLVKDGKSWRFDTAKGIEEIRRRRIGAGELEAITACRTYVLAQEEYAARRRGGAKTYSRELIGAKSGLAWPSTGREDASPLLARPADATGEGPQATWRGYHYRILTGQGSAAPGGKRSYLVNGRMTGGFALVAYPIAYGSTGIMTFLVGPDGKVLEKDIGERSDTLAAAMTSYDPDPTWKRVTD